MKIISQRTKVHNHPVIETNAKIVKMSYSDVTKGKFVSLADDKATDLDGNPVLAPNADTDGVKITTPAGDCTVDKDTYEAYQHAFTAVTTFSNTIMNGIYYIGTHAYSMLIKLDEHVKYIVAELQSEYKKVVSRLLSFLTKDGDRMGDVYVLVKHLYAPYQYVFDRLLKRIHFRKDEGVEKSKVHSMLDDAMTSLTNSFADYADKVSKILPDAEPSDSKKEPAKGAAAKATAKKS